MEMRMKRFDGLCKKERMDVGFLLQSREKEAWAL